MFRSARFIGTVKAVRAEYVRAYEKRERKKVGLGAARGKERERVQ